MIEWSKTSINAAGYCSGSTDYNPSRIREQENKLCCPFADLDFESAVSNFFERTEALHG